MIQVHVILAFALWAMSLVETDWPGAQGMDKRRQEAGGWVASIERERAGPEGGRAIAYRQRVLRRGPDDKKPVLLYEQTSTGRVRMLLRDDGLLLVQPVGPLPRLYFPGLKEPVERELPPPRQWEFQSAPYTSVDQVWFLGDCLFYARRAYPGHLLVGFERIDPAKRTVGEGGLCLEATDKEQAEATAAAPRPVVIRVGDYVLWVNAGFHSSYFPDAVRGQWKPRRVRALNLLTRKLVNRDELPEKLLRDNKVHLLAVLNEQVHNRSPELEVWIVGALARVGGPTDVARLRALARTIKETENEIAPDELRNTDKVVKEAYEKAIGVLEK
jgi:hypothetical protein